MATKHTVASLNIGWIISRLNPHFPGLEGLGLSKLVQTKERDGQELIISFSLIHFPGIPSVLRVTLTGPVELVGALVARINEVTQTESKMEKAFKPAPNFECQTWEWPFSTKKRIISQIEQGLGGADVLDSIMDRFSLSPGERDLFRDHLLTYEMRPPHQTVSKEAIANQAGDRWALLKEVDEHVFQVTTSP